MKYAALAVLSFAILFGCSPSKIAKKAIEDYKENGFAQDCADKFPPKITTGETKTDTTINTEVDCEEQLRIFNEFWEGVSTQTEQEKQALADTIAAMLARGQKPPSKTFRCPPSIHTHRVDTVESTAKLEAQARRHKAEVEAIAAELYKTDAALEAQVKKTNNRTTQRNLGWGLFGFMSIMVFRKPILGFLSGGIGRGAGLLLGLFRRKKK